MRTPLATVTLATLAMLATSAAADEPARRATVGLELYRLVNDPGEDDLYAGGTYDVAVLSAEMRIHRHISLAGSFGLVRSAFENTFSERTFLCPGNPVVGVRTERRRGDLALRAGLDLTLPTATLETDDPSGDQIITLRGAANARGRWNAWAWFPGWMSLVIPARLTLSSVSHELALEVAGGVAYDVSGENASATIAGLGQVGLESRWRASARWALEGRLALTGMHADGELERNGIAELGATLDLGDHRLRARIGRPFDAPRSEGPLTFLLGAEWRPR